MKVPKQMEDPHYFELGKRSTTEFSVGSTPLGSTHQEFLAEMERIKSESKYFLPPLSAFKSTIKDDQHEDGGHKETWMSPILNQMVNIDLDSPRQTEDTNLFGLENRPTTQFVTGSTYGGCWNKMGRMDGEGHYVFPHHSGFQGTFEDGQFKDGCYYFPMGQCIDGYQKHNYVRFADGLMYSEKFKYCHKTDRRYLSTIFNGFKPAGEERVTGGLVDRPIPKGCYDTGDGFFNPYTKCVVSALDNSTVVRIPTKAEEMWIISNCRKGWDEPVGYKPEMYERWTTGLNDEMVAYGSDNSLTESMRNDTDLHINETLSGIYVDVDELLKRERELGNLV